MFSGSYAEKSQWVRRKGEAFGLNSKGEAAYYTKEVKGKDTRSTSGYSVKVAKDRRSGTHKSSGRVSSQLGPLPEAPEPPSALRPPSKSTTKSSRSTSRRDYDAPPAQRMPSAGRSSRSSYATSEVNATQEHIPEAHPAPYSQTAPRVASSRISIAQSRVDEEYAHKAAEQDRSVAGSSKSRHSHRERNTPSQTRTSTRERSGNSTSQSGRAHSTSSRFHDDVEYDARSHRGRAPSEVDSRHSSSRHRSEHHNGSRAPSAYEDEQHDRDGEYDPEDDGIYNSEGIGPEDSASSVGAARVERTRPYAQSMIDREVEKDLVYMPGKARLYKKIDRHATYRTEFVVPAWMSGERVPGSAGSTI